MSYLPPQRSPQRPHPPRRRRPFRKSSLFALILVGLIAVIVLQLAFLSRRGDREPLGSTLAPAPGETTAGSETPVTTEVIDRIKTDFSLVLEPVPGQFLDRWPQESSVEILRDSSPLIQSLKGRPMGPGALEGVTVILDPGHGGIDGGTAYPHTPPHEIVEKNIVLPIAQYAKAALEELGAEVVMTREIDEWVSIYKRAAIAGEVVVDKLIDELEGTDKNLDLLYEYGELFEEIYGLNIDMGGGGFMGGPGSNEKARVLYDLGRQFPEILFVSIHNNSFNDNPSIGGLQIYYVDNAYHYSFTRTQAGPGDLVPPVYQNFNDQNRYRLAMTFNNTIISENPEMKTVGGPATLQQNGFVILNRTGLESVMLELGFVTNPQDRALLLTEEFQRKLAGSITSAVYDYYCDPESSFTN